MPIETEPNGQLASANPMTPGVAASGALSDSTDVDIFRYSIAAAGIFSLVFDVPTTSASIEYFRVGLYDASGVLLSRFSTGQDKTYQAAAPAAGTYYVAVDPVQYS